MLFVSKKYENLLYESLEARNPDRFAHVINELKVHPNSKPRRNFEELSIFEKVLRTPKSKRLIEICLDNGANNFQRNADGIFPIRFAVESFCPQNLEAILDDFRDVVDSSDTQDLDSLLFHGILNEKSESGDNFLHFLISHLDQRNFGDLSNMLKLMVSAGCSIHSPNHQRQSPLQLLVAKLSSIDSGSDLVDYFVTQSNSFLPKNTKTGDNLGFDSEEQNVNFNFMMKKIANRAEEDFMQNFETFKVSSQNIRADMRLFLQEAVSRNLSEIVKFLLENDADVNGSLDNKFKMAPAFLACTLGYHSVLKTLLSDPRVEFRDEASSQTLLHQVFFLNNVSNSDRQKCFDLIVADSRCTIDIINSSDTEDRVPLSLACLYGKHEMAEELLRRGAYIGHESVTENIDPSVLEEFLNDSVKTSKKIDEKNCEVFIDYKFLVPSGDEYSEMKAIGLVAENPKLKNFILHPVLFSFLSLKWKRIEFIVYFNLLCYFAFMLILGSYVVGFYKDNHPDATHCNNTREKFVELFADDTPFIYNETGCVTKEEIDFEWERTIVRTRYNLRGGSRETLTPELEKVLMKFETKFFMDLTNEYKRVYRDQLAEYEDFRKKDLFKIPSRRSYSDHGKSFWFCSIGLAILLIYEIFQFLSSPKKYFLKPSNWLDMGWIALSLFVLLVSVGLEPNNFKQICAVMILLMAAQCIQMVSQVSAFSLSLHMAILGKVTKTFFKTIAPYLIIILAFGTSFYALNYDSEVKLSQTSQLNKEIVLLKKSQNHKFEKMDQNLFELKHSFKIMEKVVLKLLKKEENLSTLEDLGDFNAEIMTNLERKTNLTQVQGGDDDYYRFYDADFDERGRDAVTNFTEALKKNAREFRETLRKESGGISEDFDEPELREKDVNGFSQPFISVISTVRMMLSDFGAIEVSEDEYFKGSMFLLFMVFLSIVLFNLLNALAISDTQEMMKVAEFVDAKKRISTLRSYEKLLSLLRTSILDLFPRVKAIMLTPNKDNVVKVEKEKSETDVGKLSKKIKKQRKYRDLVTEKWMIWNLKPKAIKFSDEFLGKVVELISEREKIETRDE